jgi:hypothetical protein
MVCKKFSEMTPVEKVLFIGELTHACMSDDDLHDMGSSLIEIAKAKGIFNNVKINPPAPPKDDSKD